MRKTLSLIAAFVVSLFALDCGEPHVRGIQLEPNSTWEGEIDFERAGRLDFALRLPSDVVLARITLLSQIYELELYAQPHERIRDVHDAPYDGSESDGAPIIVLDRLGEAQIGGATWHFAVYWPYEGLPRLGNALVRTADVALKVETFATRIDGVLTADRPLESELDHESGGFRTFKIVVPESARALRLDLFDVTSNLDLYARRASPILTFGDDVAFAEHSWGHETLVLDSTSTPTLAPGDWYIDVVDAIGPTRTLPFKLLASFEPGVPKSLRGLAPLPASAGESGLARALRAVVDIATDDGLGSGTLLTRDGWILTNAHVIGDHARPEIVVALTLDPTLPAEEMFRARLERIDFDRDLALIRIVSGLYGQAIPSDYELPTLEMGRADELSIGDSLWLVGYPSTGGTGSRVTISATRGIVAGFERADFGVLIKTDAEITSGNSGGAALDQHGKLIGVPSSTVENGSGQIAYVHPIDALPKAWRDLLAR